MDAITRSIVINRIARDTAKHSGCPPEYKPFDNRCCEKGRDCEYCWVEYYTKVVKDGE